MHVCVCVCVHIPPWQTTLPCTPAIGTNDEIQIETSWSSRSDVWKMAWIPEIGLGSAQIGHDEQDTCVSPHATPKKMSIESTIFRHPRRGKSSVPIDEREYIPHPSFPRITYCTGGENQLILSLSYIYKYAYILQGIKIALLSWFYLQGKIPLRWFGPQSKYLALLFRRRMLPAIETLYYPHTLLEHRIRTAVRHFQCWEAMEAMVEMAKETRIQGRAVMGTRSGMVFKWVAFFKKMK